MLDAVPQVAAPITTEHCLQQGRHGRQSGLPDLLLEPSMLEQDDQGPLSPGLPPRIGRVLHRPALSARPQEKEHAHSTGLSPYVLDIIMTMVMPAAPRLGCRIQAWAPHCSCAVVPTVGCLACSVAACAARQQCALHGATPSRAETRCDAISEHSAACFAAITQTC